MADPSLYTYPSPLAPFSDASIQSSLSVLSDEKNADGKSFKNPEELVQFTWWGLLEYFHTTFPKSGLEFASLFPYGSKGNKEKSWALISK